MNELNTDKLSEFLKKLRKSRDLNFDEMGALLHVSGRTVRRWENAEVTPMMDDIINICNEFNITLDEFFSAEKNTAASEIKTENNRVEKRRVINPWKWAVLITLLVYICYSVIISFQTHNYVVAQTPSNLKQYTQARSQIDGLDIIAESDGKTIIISIFNNSNEVVSFSENSRLIPQLYRLMDDGWHNYRSKNVSWGYMSPPKILEKGGHIIITADCVKSYGGILPSGKYCLIFTPVGDDGRTRWYMVEFTIK